MPCCKCEACLLRASGSRSLHTHLEHLNARFSYFVTLTYDNNSVPRLVMIDRHSERFPYVSFKCVTERLPEYGQRVFKYNVDDKEAKRLHHIIYKRSTCKGFLTYAPYSDFQNFMKRLRNRCDNYEKIRYYATSDYGPTTFRPHWHCILFFNSERLAQVIRQYISESWRFGFTDASATTSGKAIAYTSRYCNAYVALPEIYKTDAIKMVSRHSVRLGSKRFDENHYTLFTNPIKALDDCLFTIDGQHTEVYPWRSVQLRLFPRCVGYAEKTYSQIRYSYLLYRYAKDIFGNWPCSVLAELIANADPLSNPVSAYFFNRYRAFDTDFKNDEYDTFYNRILRYLYISKRFLRICDTFSMPVDSALFFIDNWYNLQSLLTLRRWYTEQVQDSEAGIYHQTMCKYYDYELPKLDTGKPVTLDYLTSDAGLLEQAQVHHYILEGIKHRAINEKNGYLVPFDYSEKPEYKLIKQNAYG